MSSRPRLALKSGVALRSRAAAGALLAGALVVATPAALPSVSPASATSVPVTAAPVTSVPVTAAPATAVVPSAATKARAAKADARIASKLKARIKNKALGKDVSVRVFDPVTGRTVYSKQSTAAQLPASNMKVVTAVNALTVIGPSTRFPTRVLFGPSTGSVVLVGGGDPLLSSANLQTLASRTVDSLTAAYGAKPTGLKVSVDATLFPAPARAKGWQSSYGLGEISPVRALARRGVASSNTTTDAADYFVKQLQAAGVSVDYLGTVSQTATGAEVARVSGHRVDEAVRAMMLRSDNQIAETLFRQTAVASGRPATWSGARSAARAALAAEGVSLKGLAFEDGSGLSRSDRLTADALVSVMRLANDGKHPRLAALVPSLPVAGRSGTLSSRFAVSPSRCARGKVKAKTGFVNGVVALTGTARGSDGKQRVFSIVANHIPNATYPRATQRAVDALAATITGCY